MHIGPRSSSRPGGTQERWRCSPLTLGSEKERFQMGPCWLGLSCWAGRLCTFSQEPSPGVGALGELSSRGVFLESHSCIWCMINLASFPLFLTYFRNVVSIHGQMYGTGSPLFGSMFSPPPHQSLLSEYLQTIMKMKCRGFPKPKCPARVSIAEDLVYSMTPSAIHRGWDSAQRGILYDDSTSKS